MLTILAQTAASTPVSRPAISPCRTSAVTTARSADLGRFTLLGSRARASTEWPRWVAAQGDADADADPAGSTTPACAHGWVNPTTWLSPAADALVP